MDGNQTSTDPGDVPLGTDRSEQPSVAIVETVAMATDSDPLEMPPLHRYVDVDALDALVAGSEDRPEGHVRVSFRYDGVDVVVRDGGRVEIGQVGDGPD